MTAISGDMAINDEQRFALVAVTVGLLESHEHWGEWSKTNLEPLCHKMGKDFEEMEKEIEGTVLSFLNKIFFPHLKEAPRHWRKTTKGFAHSLKRRTKKLLASTLC